ncbi:hypothetical protein O181_002208 [Austropuccinia psidii MF-1]|uniref:Uncharacterized protein n=1 Tax=Austropuccinia psidii MF-1 TaxID=1389203 RepID=A0A9Q3BCA7_9BASI|nr:hypothetical protein [Austropuccinia psidii MF-1]
MKDSFGGQFTIIKLIGKNLVEVRLAEEFPMKHPVFPVSLVETYNQKGEDRLPAGNKGHTPQELVEVEEAPGRVKNIMKARKITLNGKHHRQYMVRFM